MWKRLGYNSYGEYMTHKKSEPPKPRPKAVCKNCGGPLVGGRLRYCCDDCRIEFKAKDRKGDKYV